MVDFTIIKQDIIDVLRTQKLHKVLVFGSYANGNVHDDSDVDLLVILDKKGISNNYGEILLNKKTISTRLRQLRKTIPVDLLVYTRDEWAMMKNSGSSFVKQVEAEGIRII